MAEPFLGEVRVFSFNFPPKGWAFCNGQVLPINQNQALFALLGTTYGGNGQTTFALPDLRGRVPVHRGGGFTQGQAGGAETHTVTPQEMPAHVHAATGTASTATTGVPTGLVPAIAAAALGPIYSAAAPSATLHAATVAPTGGSQPHTNMQPFLAVNACIALVGIFPSQN